MKDYRKIAIELGQTLISKAPETKEDVERMLPELKEGSEDKGIRKALIDGFKRYDDGALFNGCLVREILFWLEKQGEQKPADKSEPKQANLLLELVPKQEWSEEDEWNRNEIIANLNEFIEIYKRDDIKPLIDWLKSLRPQNNVTDEELAQAKKDAYNDALDKIEYYSGEPTFDDGWSAAIWYLKKRNALPQSTWKPSEGQMKFLKKCIEAYNEVTFPTEVRVLSSLYNDLKKL